MLSDRSVRIVIEITSEYIYIYINAIYNNYNIIYKAIGHLNLKDIIYFDTPF